MSDTSGMAVPWLRLLDGVLGARDMVRAATQRPVAADQSTALEAPLIGLVVGALREAFTRDSERLDLERQRLEDERRRAERALRLELLRQAGDREVSRLRLLGGAALASLFGALFLVTFFGASSTLARTTAGLGAMCLLGALAAAFTAHADVSRALAVAHTQTDPGDLVTSPAARALPWLLLGGLAAVALAVLLQ
jgi:hypothetical protein